MGSNSSTFSYFSVSFLFGTPLLRTVAHCCAFTAHCCAFTANCCATIVVRFVVIRAVQGTKLECSQQCRGCARFSRKAVTRRLTAALLPAAVCLLAFFGFVGILYFLQACLIIITHTQTHTPLKKKAGAHPPTKPAKKKERRPP